MTLRDLHTGLGQPTPIAQEASRFGHGLFRRPALGHELIGFISGPTSFRSSDVVADGRLRDDRSIARTVARPPSSPRMPHAPLAAPRTRDIADT